MKLSGNTILITGGGTGIGRGLAESFHKLGNQVIVAGRRREPLDETTAANPGMKSLTVDMQDADAIREFAARAVSGFPALNVLINNAGIMRPEKLAAGNAGIMRAENPAARQPGGDSNLPDAEAIVATNLLGPIRLTTALLPHIEKQSDAVVINVSSGLAFVPLALTPTYCATKAAIHSYTQSLRYQLRGRVEVLELIPPYVATDLMNGRSDPRAMPLDKFIAEAMEILQQQPTPAEICVENVKRLRFAAESGQFDAIFNGMNAAISGEAK